MSKLKINELANLADTESVPIGDVINGSARAWVNFNGKGTVAIRDSYNVSSITDNGTGRYTVNFETAMPDANYSLLATSEQGTGSVTNSFEKLSGTPLTSTSAPLINKLNSVGPSDNSFLFVAIFR